MEIPKAVCTGSLSSSIDADYSEWLKVWEELAGKDELANKGNHKTKVDNSQSHENMHRQKIVDRLKKKLSDINNKT